MICDGDVDSMNFAVGGDDSGVKEAVRGESKEEKPTFARSSAFSREVRKCKTPQVKHKGDRVQI